MKKVIVAILVFGLFFPNLSALAAFDDFIASDNITVEGVKGDGLTVNMLIFAGSTAEEVTIDDSGVFTVLVSSGSSFLVGSEDPTVAAINYRVSGGSTSCVNNTTPGVSYAKIEGNSAYIIEPKTSACAYASCPTVPHALTYNSYPTCGPAICEAGYRVVDANCVPVGGGGVIVPSIIPSSASSTPSSSSTSPTPISSPPSSTFTKIFNGDLVRAVNDFKVFLIQGGYKRWIQNPKIFAVNNFNWQNVKIVSPADLSKYQESSLVRVKNEKKVYEINSDGTKHWLDMTPAQFVQSGRKWDMVYEISKAELALYRLGAKIVYKVKNILRAIF